MERCQRQLMTVWESVTTPQLKTLFLVREPPFPTQGGVALRNWQNINILAQWSTVGIFSIYRQSTEPYSLPGALLWQHCSNQVERGAIARKIVRRSYPLKLEYPYADGLYTKQAQAQLQAFLQVFQPDLIIIEELWFYPYLPLLLQTGKPIVLDSHNLETVLVKDLFQLEVRSPRLRQQILQGWRNFHLARIERRMVEQVSQNWVCSSPEKQALLQTYCPAPTWVIPNGIDIYEYHRVRTGQVSPPPDLPLGPPTVLFLGSLSYQPNIEAVEWLLTEIDPLLRQTQPHYRLLIVGRNPKHWMRAAAQNHPHLWVTGTVDDVRPYLAAAQVMVVPLKQGGGTRLKILEAFAAGCPVVATSKGAEGLEGEEGIHLLLRNTTAEISAAITQLWIQPALRTALADRAWELVNQTYSRAAIARPIRAALDSLGVPLD